MSVIPFLDKSDNSLVFKSKKTNSNLCCPLIQSIKLQKYNKGDISLGYLLKLGSGALLVLLANTVFDWIVDVIQVNKVQIMVSSPRIQTVQLCVYQSIMDGSYSRLPSCTSNSGVFINSNSPIKVSSEGEIYIEEDIRGTKVSLVLKPVITSNGGIEWQCSGTPEKHMPTSCSYNH